MIFNDELRARGTVLLVDEHEDARDMLALLLGCNGFEVRCAASVQTALDALETGPVDVVITEVFMNGRYVEGLGERLRRPPGMRASFIMGYSAGCPLGGAEAIAAAGLDAFFLKPAPLRKMLGLLPDRWSTRSRPGHLNAA